MERPTRLQLVTLCGVSPGTASDILRGKRKPGPALAVHIFRRTGWKCDLIAHLDDEQIAMVEGVVGSWTPRVIAKSENDMRRAA